MVSVILTFRGVDNSRLNNLYAVQGHFYRHFPEWELIIVEQDTHSRLEFSKFSAQPVHQLAHNAGPFNKSWGMNIGFRLSTSSTLVMCDADMLVGKEALAAAADKVAQSADMVRPYRSLIDLSAAASRVYMENGKLPVDAGEQGYDRGYVSEHICLAGGVFVIRRAFFETIGGFDEHFVGWGGEDDALSIRAHSLGDRLGIAQSALAWHLWHPRSASNGHEHYESNLEQLARYRNYSQTQHRQLAAAAFRRAGDLHKYTQERT